MSLMAAKDWNTAAEKWRIRNPEQFHMLVEMHLSFALDMNLDDFQCLANKSPLRNMKKQPTSFRKTHSKGVMEGAPLTQEGICQVYQLIEHLNQEENLSQEGVFRKTGNLNRQQELKSLLNSGIPLDLTNSHFSVHDCACVLKSFLTELPESLLTNAHYSAHCQIADRYNKKKGVPKIECQLLRALQLLVIQLPAENRKLLQDVLDLLHRTNSLQEKNKMNAESLATLFTPNLFCPRKLVMETLQSRCQQMVPLVTFMILHAKELFQIPKDLATDIQFQLLKMEKEKLFCPLQCTKGADDRVSPGAVNTVFSFVDHSLSGHADGKGNTTETALAELYAHIQALPETSKEKKIFISKLNKENGMGVTPVLRQTQAHTRSARHAHSRSFGDSMKRHLFPKSLKRSKSLKCPKSGTSENSLDVPLSSENIPDDNNESKAVKRTLFHKNVEDTAKNQNGSSSHPSDINTCPKSTTVSSDDQGKASLKDGSQTIHGIRHPAYVVQSSSTAVLHKKRGNRKRSLSASSLLVLSDSLSQMSDSEQSPVPLKSPRLSTTLEEYKVAGSGTLVVQSNSLRNFVSNSTAVTIFPLPSPSNCSALSDASATTHSLTACLPSDSPLHFSCSVPPPTSSLTSTPGPRVILQTYPSSHFPATPVFMLSPVADEGCSFLTPITRYTQRMSKAMQETLMTARSRNPVFVLSSSDTTQSE